MFGKKKSEVPAHPLAWHFRAISLLAVVVLAVDAYYSGRYGATIDTASMIGLSAISVGSGLLLIAVIYFYRLGHEGFAKGLSAVWVICFAFNIMSNMGVATSNRVVEVQGANLKQAAFQERGKSKSEAKQQLQIFTKQLNDLFAKNEWAATVTAGGLRSQVADLRVARQSESLLGGCGPKCRGIENQISDLQGRIAVAERRHGLEKRIEATKSVLASARKDLETADAGISNTAAQASLYSRWTVGWVGDGESTSAVRNSNELMGMAQAIVIAVASVGLSLAGVWVFLMTVTPNSLPMYTGARSSSLPNRTDNKDVSVPPVPSYASQAQVAPQPTFGVDVRTVGDMNLQALRERLAGRQIQVAAA